MCKTLSTLKNIKRFFLTQKSSHLELLTQRAHEILQNIISSGDVASIEVKELEVLSQEKVQTLLSWTTQSKVVNSLTQLHFVSDSGISTTTIYFHASKQTLRRVDKVKFL